MDDTTMQMSTAKLTSRQQEFLHSLVALYETGKHAVSYVDVASRMKVSKWTAYDVLRGLYQRGFLLKEHEIRSARGRSQILYSPVENVDRVSEDTGDRAERRAAKWLMGKIDQHEKYSITTSINLVAHRVRREKNPFQVVLHTSLMVVLFARVFSLDISRLVNVRTFVVSGLSADMILGLLGEIMFSLMRNEEWLMANLGLPPESTQEFAECEDAFASSLTQLTAGEKRLMVSVIGQALAL